MEKKGKRILRFTCNLNLKKVYALEFLWDHIDLCFTEMSITKLIPNFFLFFG